MKGIERSGMSLPKVVVSNHENLGKNNMNKDFQGCQSKPNKVRKWTCMERL
jgi:hypothetical protein